MPMEVLPTRTHVEVDDGFKGGRFFGGNKNVAAEDCGFADLCGTYGTAEKASRMAVIPSQMTRAFAGGLPKCFNGISDACILVDADGCRVYIFACWMHGLRDSNGKFRED